MSYCRLTQQPDGRWRCETCGRVYAMACHATCSGKPVPPRPHPVAAEVARLIAEDRSPIPAELAAVRLALCQSNACGQWSPSGCLETPWPCRRIKSTVERLLCSPLGCRHWSANADGPLGD